MEIPAVVKDTNNKWSGTLNSMTTDQIQTNTCSKHPGMHFGEKHKTSVVAELEATESFVNTKQTSQTIYNSEILLNILAS